MFIIDFVYTSAEEEFEERVIHSNTNHLESAQDTQSPDTFYSLFDNIVEPLNEQATPQPSRVQNDEESKINLIHCIVVISEYLYQRYSNNWRSIN